MAEPRKRKLLSIATGVRNDHYVANYSWRVKTILNYMAYGLEKIGRLDDVEIMVADWNSPSPMVDELDLSPAARKITHFFDVPTELAVSVQRGSPYPINIVFNSSIRRATGEYICMADNDCLYSPASLDIVCRLLDRTLDCGIDLRKVIMPIARRQIAQELTLCNPSVEELDDYLNHYANLVSEDRIYNGTVGMAGSFLMHRDLWNETGAIDEGAVHWGWTDIDLVLRANRRYPWINLSNFGVSLFHMGHPPTFVKSDASQKKKVLKFNVHQMPYPYEINANNENWGLGQAELPVYAPPPEDQKVVSWPARSSQEWRIEKLSQLSRELVLEQMLSAETNTAIATLLTNFAQAFPGKLPGIRSMIQRAQDSSARDWDVLAALVWYCRTLLPLTYVEAGLGSGLHTALAVGFYPPVSVYALESWNPFENPVANHPLAICGLLDFVKHQGYLRFIADQSSDAYAHFWGQPGSPKTADLIVYANSYTAERVLSEATPLLANLAPGGGFILQHSERVIFTKVLATLQAEYPRLAWFSSERCAFALNTAHLPGWVTPLNKASQAGRSQSVFVPAISVNELNQKVDRLFNAGREDEAVAMLHMQIQLKSKNAELYMLMGRVLSNLGLPRNARYYFERYVELNPGEMAGHANLAISLASVGDTLTAQKVLEGYLKKAPEQPTILRLLGEVLAGQSLHAEAIPYYKKALALDPQDINGFSGLADAAQETGDLALAQEALNALRRLSPDMPDLEKRRVLLSQRITIASEVAQKILTSSQIAATISQTWAALTPDVVYLVRLNAGNLRANGNEALAQSYESIAQILQNMLGAAGK